MSGLRESVVKAALHYGGLYINANFRKNELLIRVLDYLKQQRLLLKVVAVKENALLYE